MRFVPIGLAAAVVVAFALVVAVRDASPVNWGAHHHAFLPESWRALAALFAVLVAGGWWFLGRGSARWSRVSVTMTVVAAGAAFWFAREQSYFMGDGFLFLRALFQGTPLTSNESLVPAAAWNLHRLLGGPDPALFFAAIAVAWGVVYAVVVTAFARLAAPDRAGRALVTLLLLVAGFTRLFYGYVESAVVLVPLVAAFAYFGARYAEGRGSLWPAALLFAASVPVHVSAVALLPALWFLAWTGDPAGRGRRIAASVALPASAVALGAFAFGGGAEVFPKVSTGLGNMLLPFGAPDGDRFAYGLFTYERLSDFFQEQIVVGPFAALLALPLAFAAGKARGRAARFLLWAGIPWWIASFVFGRPSGAARDWDLFAAASVPLAFAAAWLVVRLPEWSARGFGTTATAALLLALGAFHTAGWVLVDTDADRGIRRLALLYGPGSRDGAAARAFAFEQISMDYLDRGDAASGEAALVEAYRTRPGDSRVAGNLGAILTGQGRTAEAVDVLRGAAESDSTREVVQYQLARAYLASGNLAASEQAYRRAVALNPQFRDAQLELASLLIRAGRVDDAELVLTTAVQRFPGDGSVLAGIGQLHEVRGKTAEAEQAYRTALLAMPENTGIAFNLARLYLNNKRPRDAEQLLEGVVARTPEDVEAWINLGAARIEQGKLDLAREAVERARELAPSRPEPYVNLSRIALMRGNKVLAVRELRRYAAVDSTSETAARVRLVAEELEAEISADTARVDAP